MLSDVTWRKMPTDILTNENMTYIESHMPKGLEYAPFMFYQAALKKADNDGIFDIEDGVIFARLMRVPSPAIVFQIVNLMGQRRMLYRESTSSLCYLADWEYTTGKGRTLAERRMIVQQKIKEMAMMPKAAELKARQNAEIPPFEPFESPENVQKPLYDDKNAENVAKNTFDDKTPAECRDIEREKERERERHTQRDRESMREEERKKDASASAEFPIDSAPAPAKRKEPLGKEKKQKKIDVVPEPFQVTDTTSLVNGALSENQDEEKKTADFLSVVNLLEAFFIQNSFGYDLKKGHKQLDQVAFNILKIKTDEPFEIIAGKICDIFLKMHNSEGPWKDIPLQPALLNKSAVWAYILSQLGKQLKPAKRNSISKLMKEYEIKAEKEAIELDAEINGEYLKYGISPDDPNKSVKLLQKKAAEQSTKTDEPMDIPIPENEIF